jgi:hypothetical protein
MKTLLSWMNRSLLLFANLFVSCSLGLSGPTDPIAETQLPRSRFVVKLYGPDYKHHYRYSVTDGGSVLISRFLGTAWAAEMETAEVMKEGPGLYRIRWGVGSGAQFAVIDAANRKIVGDSNTANPSNEPF